MIRPTLGLLACLALACGDPMLVSDPPASEATVAQPATVAASIKVLSWNVEWLDVAGQGMVPRSDQELQEMAQVIAQQNPDVVVLQEVASEKAARTLLPSSDWELAVEDRRDDQRVVVGVRKGLEFERKADLKPLAVGNSGLRHGVDVELKTGGGSVRVLGVHLKAGCQWDPLGSSSECSTLEQQAQVLETWTDERAAAGDVMVVVGDFNRQMHSDDPFYRFVNDGDPPSLYLSLGPGKDPACEPKRRHPIDHFLVGGARTRDSKQIPLQRPPLSDHCPIVATLEI